MSDGDRKHKRKAISKDGWIASPAGEAIHGCVMVDVSPGGARLWMETTRSTPNEFVLWLTPSGGVQRPCKIRWRTENEIGVQFLSKHEMRGEQQVGNIE